MTSSSLSGELGTRVRPQTRRFTQLYAIFGVLFGFAFPALATIVSLASSGLPWSLANIASAHRAQPLLWIIDTAPLFLGVFAALIGLRQDAFEATNLELARRARELAQAKTSLEQRVAERTQELEDRDRQMRNAVQATRSMTQIREPDQLAHSAVALLAESFTDFGVDLYLLDERQATAVLTASSLPEPMSSVGASLEVSSPGLVGQVATSGAAAQLTVGASGPEMAFPLQARGRLFGVVHFRAGSRDVQLPSDMGLLQLVIDQLASAFETARLFAEAQTSLQRVQEVSGQATESAWRQQAAGTSLAFEYTPAGVRPTKPGSTDPRPGALRLPLELRGRQIGSIALTRRGDQDWTDADLDLAQKTAAQVALALENARLLEETRQRALQEQRLSELSALLGQSLDLDSLLQAAARELAALPDVAEASVYLSPAATVGGTAPSQRGTRE